jgi:hypothetical protein
VSLVFPALTDGFEGLGTAASHELVDMFERRRALDLVARSQAASLWRAYADSDPTALPQAPAALDFAQQAVRLHLSRFPSTRRGLDEIETATLRGLVSGARSFGDLFRAVTRTSALRIYGMGDVQYAAALRDLAPLIAIDRVGAAFSTWRITLTPRGIDVLEGRLDGLGPRALDRWLGGVHLRPGGPDWRWDGARIVRG